MQHLMNFQWNLMNWLFFSLIIIRIINTLLRQPIHRSVFIMNFKSARNSKLHFVYTNQ